MAGGKQDLVQSGQSDSEEQCPEQEEQFPEQELVEQHPLPEAPPPLHEEHPPLGQPMHFLPDFFARYT